MKKVAVFLGTVAVLAGLGAGSTAYARTIAGYDINLPRADFTTTGRIKKVNTTSAVNNIDQIGNKYTIQMAIKTTSDFNDVTAMKSSNKTGRHLIDYYNASKIVGKETTLALSTPWNVLVSVHTSGSWSPDAN